MQQLCDHFALSTHKGMGHAEGRSLDSEQHIMTYLVLQLHRKKGQRKDIGNNTMAAI